MENEIEVNGKRYVLALCVSKSRETTKLGKYVIIRTYSAGVFAGHLKSRDGKEVVLNDARRLWYWMGAASLSQMAIDGVSKPDECKFPAPLGEIILTETIEIIPTTKKAEESIKSVKEWKA